LKFKSVIKLLRLHQWVKNLLILAPLILAHKYQSSEQIKVSLYGMLSFSLLASIVYIINDFLDLESDRKHPTKKNRPFASGEISLTSGVILICFLLCSLLLMLLFTGTASYLLLGYFVLNILYSTSLKKVALLDVFILTSFYLIRIFYGAAINDIELSHWFLSFSFFLFLSLAFMKRYSEVENMYKSQGITVTNRRDYTYADLFVIGTLGITCSGMAVLVFTLYLNSDDTRQLYSRPELLWAIQFTIFYWTSRLWINVTRGLIKEDPLTFALKDIGGLLAMAISILVFYFAI
jgi:4-hydroxybenzoate polyprenyltransferase